MGRAGIQTGTSTKVSVGNTSTTVLAANDNREVAIFANDADETIYLNILGGTAVMNEGIPVLPGEKFVMEFPILSKSLITGICTTGTKNMAVVEGE